MSKILVGTWLIKLIKIFLLWVVKILSNRGGWQVLTSQYVPVALPTVKKKEQTKCLSHSGSENCQRQLQHSATKLVLLCTAGNYVQNNQWRWVWTDDHGLPRHHTIFTSFSRNTKQNGLPDDRLHTTVYYLRWQTMHNGRFYNPWQFLGL